MAAPIPLIPSGLWGQDILFIFPLFILTGGTCGLGPLLGGGPKDTPPELKALKLKKLSLGFINNGSIGLFASILGIIGVCVFVGDVLLFLLLLFWIKGVLLFFLFGAKIVFWSIALLYKKPPPGTTKPAANAIALFFGLLLGVIKYCKSFLCLASVCLCSWE